MLTPGFLPEDWAQGRVVLVFRDDNSLTARRARMDKS